MEHLERAGVPTQEPAIMTDPGQNFSSSQNVRRRGIEQDCDTPRTGNDTRCFSSVLNLEALGVEVDRKYFATAAEAIGRFLDVRQPHLPQVSTSFRAPGLEEDDKFKGARRTRGVPGTELDSGSRTVVGEFVGVESRTYNDDPWSPRAGAVSTPDLIPVSRPERERCTTGTYPTEDEAGAQYINFDADGGRGSMAVEPE
ncbi:hypothetical protein CTheo_8767 [Ceratobasidium theobromae]|uniref:Uncharacterized protein n=1 Tax=Ceratobasidium theobromae TaxID=1582974 RepID=A0A5N5Q7P2_9AGAM|nr:hypothetical protein CTheo_8767 [Ceratobasidium theobromae]